MAKKSLKDALEWLEKSEARQAVIEDLDKSIEYRKSELLWLTGSSIGLDFDRTFSQHDLRRTEVRWIEFLKNMPNKLIEIESLKEASDEEVKDSEIQENIDALADFNV